MHRYILWTEQKEYKPKTKKRRPSYFPNILKIREIKSENKLVPFVTLGAQQAIKYLVSFSTKANDILNIEDIPDPTTTMVTITYVYVLNHQALIEACKQCSLNTKNPVLCLIYLAMFNVLIFCNIEDRQNKCHRNG